VTEYRQQLPEQSQNVINEQTFEEHEVSGLSGAGIIFYFSYNLIIRLLF
jgi:hypothetical protein